MKQSFTLHVFLYLLISNIDAQVWLKPNGRVGIGDDEPIAKLQVNSTSTFTNPGIAIFDSSASETQGGILQFRSVTWDDNHFNLRGSLSQYASGLDSKFDLFFRENLLMSVKATSITNQHLLYNAANGSLRAGYLNPGSIGEYSMAAGYNNIASGLNSTAFGGGNQATGQSSTVLGGGSTASESYATAIGYDNNASGPFTLAAGRYGLANGFAAVAMGDSTSAFGRTSLSTGYKTLASGDYSTATGSQSTASGLYSLSGGFATTASNTSSMAFGFVTQATGVSATALGYSTLAAGENSVAINSVTKALGPNSFTSGLETKTNGWMSSAFGESTTARSYASAVFGRFNDTISTSNPDYWVNEDPLFMIGNGSSTTERNNAWTIYKNGNLLAKHPTAVVSDPGALTPPVSGAGTRLMWLPEKSAFRAGTVSGDVWDASNIGAWSFATGYNSKATDVYAFATGTENIASGYASSALGGINEASGDFSTALGFQTLANSTFAVAMGANSEATGNAAVAMGQFTDAEGNNSVAMGFGTEANSYSSLVLGQYNDSIAGVYPTIWNSTDPVLIIGNGTGNATRHNALTIYKNGNFVAKNPTAVTTDPGVLPVPVSGEGTRLMWLPEKSAFRVGTVTGTVWDDALIGTWSFGSGWNARADGIASTAMGASCLAQGLASTALGYFSEALSDYSTAIGYQSQASGDRSVAMGNSTEASGSYSTSMGSISNASGVVSTSMGYNTTASGDYSTALGHTTAASGNSSIAMGFNTDASGEQSIAMGNGSYASGSRTTAFGSGTEAKAFASTAIGSNNDEIAGSSETLWVETDPVFYVGNGEFGFAPSNAMVVYKNANTDISGYTRLGTETDDAPRIKMKQLTGSTGPDYNSSSSITHGLTAAKILAVDVLVQWGVDLFAPPEYSASLDLRYNYYVNASAIVIQNNTPDGDCLICEKYVKILITYQE